MTLRASDLNSFSMFLGMALAFNLGIAVFVGLLSPSGLG